MSEAKSALCWMMVKKKAARGEEVVVRCGGELDCPDEPLDVGHVGVELRVQGHTGEEAHPVPEQRERVEERLLVDPLLPLPCDGREESRGCIDFVFSFKIQ